MKWKQKYNPKYLFYRMYSYIYKALDDISWSLK
ncbi:hypothetical protein BcerKBAB4_5822 (plasmid) [Bacillus mycoides KBAB4]|uniref:Uncharacterized protein n=1 Tax=Bacillus mycoides (strain KBAB4) TaxID=315730 RepID=A9VVQ8_BACMK|nr:hypothetical protein BcerKBAB4_5822 [Bacillus mycoides KBAB4]